MQAPLSPPENADEGVHTADFHDMRLRVGENLLMLPVAIAEPVQHRVSFIGAHRRHSFLVSLPVVHGNGIWIKPGGEFSFRVLHGMYAYAFTSRAIRARSRPYPYAHFAIPESVMRRRIRRASRVDTRLPVEVTRADGLRAQAIMRNLSLHGAQLQLTGLLDEVGRELRVALPVHLPDTQRAITLAATIRNSSDPDKSAAAGQFHYGIAFQQVTPEDSGILLRFIEHLIAEQVA